MSRLREYWREPNIDESEERWRVGHVWRRFVQKIHTIRNRSEDLKRWAVDPHTKSEDDRPSYWKVLRQYKVKHLKDLLSGQETRNEYQTRAPESSSTFHYVFDVYNQDHNPQRLSGIASFKYRSSMFDDGEEGEPIVDHEVKAEVDVEVGVEVDPLQEASQVEVPTVHHAQVHYKQSSHVHDVQNSSTEAAQTADHNHGSDLQSLPNMLPEMMTQTTAIWMKEDNLASPQCPTILIHHEQEDDLPGVDHEDDEEIKGLENLVLSCEDLDLEENIHHGIEDDRHGSKEAKERDQGKTMADECQEKEDDIPYGKDRSSACEEDREDEEKHHKHGNEAQETVKRAPETNEDAEDAKETDPDRGKDKELLKVKVKVKSLGRAKVELLGGGVKLKRSRTIHFGKRLRCKNEVNGIESGEELPTSPIEGKQLAYIAIFEYKAVKEDEINLLPGDILRPFAVLEEGWWVGEKMVYNSQGPTMGVFPEEYVRLMPSKYMTNG